MDAMAPRVLLYKFHHLSPPFPHLTPKPPRRMGAAASTAPGGKVLSGNGITRYEQGAYGLVCGVAEGFCAAVELSDTERDQLLELCRQRLDAFRMQRGEEMGCLLTEKPAASGTGAATAPRSAARSKTGCSPAPGAAASAAGPMSTSEPWRWTTSCPGTTAARTT